MLQKLGSCLEAGGGERVESNERAMCHTACWAGCRFLFVKE